MKNTWKLEGKYKKICKHFSKNSLKLREIKILEIKFKYSGKR